MSKKTTLIILIIVALSLFVYFQYVLAKPIIGWPPLIVYHQVSLASIEQNPQNFDGTKVLLRGYVIKNEGAFFGPQYELAETKPPVVVGGNNVVYSSFNISTAKQIAIGTKSGTGVNMSGYISYTFDGRNFTQTDGFKPVILKGTIKYIGQVTDSPPYHLVLDDIVMDLD